MATTPTELYKQFRPNVWSSMVGQENVVRSLQVALKTGKLPTAYLFAGPRGTGKTTAAFILAKAVNCENRDNNMNPCNKCETCVNIDKGAQMGVSYVSMANRGGAEDVRSLVTDARLNQPVNRQVFILDEIHNIHPKAFDALLIPLEDPTMPALFIFCSTEIHKVPQTILSRVQQRKFRLVDSETLTKLLTSVAKKAGLDASEENIQSAVRMGRGSVRDSLTSLDSILATGSEITSFEGKLLKALSENDATNSLRVIAEANIESVNFREFTEVLYEDLRDILLLSNGVEKDLVGTPPVSNLKEVWRGLGGQKGIFALMKHIGDALDSMTMGADQRIVLEVSLFKWLAWITAARAAKKG